MQEVREISWRTTGVQGLPMRDVHYEHVTGSEQQVSALAIYSMKRTHK